MKPRARLLLFDGSSFLPRTFAQELRALGHEVATAARAGDALACVRDLTFDLVAIVLSSRGDDGLVLARDVCTAHGTPLVFLSDGFEREAIESALGHGGFMHLTRPSVALLDQVIEPLLAFQRDIRELRQREDSLRQALDRERQVSIAIGVLMERQRVGSRAAFAALRQRARSERRRVAQVAAEITNAAELLNGMSPEAARGSGDADAS